jgi:3'(2'), 5'-bisphosphate nucleotidase
MIDELFVNKLIDFGQNLSKDIVDIQNSNFEVSFKSDDSPLTQADLHSNKEIKKFLSENSSVSNFISEEDKEIDYETRKDWDFYWVVDPIDGTKEFVKGGDDFCVNIALCEGDSPIFGYVSRPKTGDYYYASKGGGAFKNKSPIKSSWQEDPLRVVASKSHINDKTQHLLDLISKHYNLEILNIGSSLKFCLIAEGLADFYPRLSPTMEWDTCAPHIIAEESGCEINADCEDNNLLYNKPNLLNPYFTVSNQFV